MTREVGGKKLKVANLIFWLDLLPFVSFTFLFLCTMSLIGCNGQNAKVSGTGQVQSPSFKEREAALKTLLNRKFENPDVHFELGQLYQEQMQWAKAEYHYNTALSFNPVHRQAQAAMVKLFFNSGNPAKAKTYANNYIKDSTISAKQSLELALAFQKQQLNDYAFECYQQALQLGPNSADVHKYVGYYYLNKNDKVRATEHFKLSFRLDPNQADVAGELGRLGVQVEIPRKTEKIEI